MTIARPSLSVSCSGPPLTADRKERKHRQFRSASSLTFLPSTLTTVSITLCWIGQRKGELEAKKSIFSEFARSYKTHQGQWIWETCHCQICIPFVRFGKREGKARKSILKEIGKSRGLRLTSSYTRRSFAFAALLQNRRMVHQGAFSSSCDPERRPPLNTLTSSDRLVGSNFCRIPGAL